MSGTEIATGELMKGQKPEARQEVPSEAPGYAATDKEVWSRETNEEPFVSYASVRINNDASAMTLCLGGVCCTMTIEKWHKLAMDKCCEPA